MRQVMHPIVQPILNESWSLMGENVGPAVVLIVKLVLAVERATLQFLRLHILAIYRLRMIRIVDMSCVENVDKP